MRAGTEVWYNLLPTLSGITDNSPSLFVPSDCGHDRGRVAVEVKVTKEANTTRESMARNSLRDSMLNRRDAHEAQMI